MKYLLILFLNIYSLTALVGQRCNFDTLFVYELRNIDSTEILRFKGVDYHPVQKDYYEDGIKVKSIDQPTDWDFEVHSFYFYDSLGRIVKSIDTTQYKISNRTTVDSIFYFYNDGRLAKKIETRSDSPLFDEISTIHSYSNDTLYRSIIYGNITELKEITYKVDDLIYELTDINELYSSDYTKAISDENERIRKIYRCDSNDDCILKKLVISE